MASPDWHASVQRALASRTFAGALTTKNTPASGGTTCRPTNTQGSAQQLELEAGQPLLKVRGRPFARPVARRRGELRLGASIRARAGEREVAVSHSHRVFAPAFHAAQDTVGFAAMSSKYQKVRPLDSSDAWRSSTAFPAQEFALPEEFPATLREFTKEVLRDQPQDINTYGTVSPLPRFPAPARP